MGRPALTLIPNPSPDELAALLTAMRPDWPPTTITDVIHDATCRQRGFTRTALALLRAATDPATISPRRILAAGPWWQDAAQPAAPVPPQRFVAVPVPAVSDATRTLVERTRRDLRLRLTQR